MHGPISAMNSLKHAEASARKENMNAGRIVVAYAGVHQAYQLALAADEIGELKEFYCSLYNHPSKCGPRFANFVGQGLFEGRHAEGLDLRNVVEFPWPLLLNIVRDRAVPRFKGGWLAANCSFDWWVSRKISATPPDIFVGTAACDLYSLKAAKACGVTALHDCPSLHPKFELELLREAAEKASIRYTPRLPWLKRNAMSSRKIQEYSLADKLLVYSKFHARGFEEAGISKDRIFVSPLWVDRTLWHRTKPNSLGDLKPNRPLKLLFVGSLTLRKGIPFLLKAVATCGKAVTLTIVGAQNAQTTRLLHDSPPSVSYLPEQSKAELRRIYESHDVLVLPSVGDSFGFVALEAMACGLPVILTENCGAPIPDPSWMVRAMDIEGLVARIMRYADDRTLVIEDGARAVAFASSFTPLA